MVKGMGRAGFEPAKAYSQQIYSLPRLAASVPTRDEGFRGSPFAISQFAVPHRPEQLGRRISRAVYIGLHLAHCKRFLGAF
jgi:hypothetical protein